MAAHVPKPLPRRLANCLLLIVQDKIVRENWQYKNVTTKRCVDESVYLLAEKKVITLHKDGTITITDEGQWHVRRVQFD
jgi:hypothetical protein